MIRFPNYIFTLDDLLFYLLMKLLPLLLVLACFLLLTEEKQKKKVTTKATEAKKPKLENQKPQTQKTKKTKKAKVSKKKKQSTEQDEMPAEEEEELAKKGALEYYSDKYFFDYLFMFGNFVSIVIWVMGCKYFPRTFAAIGITYFVTHFLFTKYMLFGTILLGGGSLYLYYLYKKGKLTNISIEKEEPAPSIDLSNAFKQHLQTGGPIHISVSQQKNQEPFKGF